MKYHQKVTFGCITIMPPPAVSHPHLGYYFQIQMQLTSHGKSINISVNGLLVVYLR